MTSAELRRIVEAMTERPWRRCETMVCGPNDMHTDVADCAIGAEPEDAEWKGAISDATAICTLANHADALVKLVEACERWRDGYQLTDDILVALAAVHAIKGTP